MHLQISPYAADYRYLYIAYEINALQGWKKRLEGVGGGGGGVGEGWFLKIVLGKGGCNFKGQLFLGGERVQFWYTTPF